MQYVNIADMAMEEAEEPRRRQRWLFETDYIN